MKFGWMTLSLSPSAADDLACVHQQLEQGVLAEAMGFDYLGLTEHNFTGECAYADPIPFAGALAARTSRARLGFAVIQMALHHVMCQASWGRARSRQGHGVAPPLRRARRPGVPSLTWGPPTWPPNAQRSERPGEPVALLDCP